MAVGIDEVVRVHESIVFRLFPTARQVQDRSGIENLGDVKYDLRWLNFVLGKKEYPAGGCPSGGDRTVTTGSG